LHFVLLVDLCDSPGEVTASGKSLGTVTISIGAAQQSTRWEVSQPLKALLFPAAFFITV
jgi:hypothetical protein